MQGNNARDDGRQCNRNLRIADVRLSPLAPDIELMDVRVERIAHLADVSGKLNDRASRRDLDSLESVASQPVGYRLNVRVRGAELLSKLIRREPLMKIRRVLALLLIHQLPQRGLLVRTALQKQKHAVHRRGISDRSLIKLGASERMHVTLQAHQLSVVDGLSDACRDGCRLSGRRQALLIGLRHGANGRQRQNHRKKEKGIAKHRRMEFHVSPTLQI